MILFQFISIPLFAVLIISQKRTDDEEWKKMGLLFLKGALTFLPAFLLQLLLKSFISFSYRSLSIYFYFFLMDHFLYITLALAGFTIWMKSGDLLRIEFQHISSFLAGFYFLLSILLLLAYFREYDSYHLFYLPLLRLITILLASFFLIKAVSSYGLGRIGFCLCLAAIPLSAASVSFAYLSHRILLASLLTGAMLVISVVLWYFVME